MREDIRLLGRILGDTVREQNGDDVFDLVERARVESFRVRRSEIDRAELAAHVRRHRRPPGDPRHPRVQPLLAAGQPRRGHPPRAAPPLHVGAPAEPPQNSSLAATFASSTRPTWTPATVAEELAGALVGPVITAHPTEMRRKTIFEVQHQITELMRLARPHGAPATSTTAA